MAEHTHVQAQTAAPTQERASAVSVQKQARATLLQRKCACGASGSCEKCAGERRLLQRKAEAGGHAPTNGGGRGAVTEGGRGAAKDDVPGVVRETLGSPGRPLDSAARSFMESRFGHDFSRVRIHTDARASASARSVGAAAYTVGHDIVFGAGRYAPAQPAGRRLLAHELAHVVQQRSAAESPRVRPSALSAGPSHDAFEREADEVARAVLSGRPVARTHARLPVPRLQRAGEGEREYKDDELKAYLNYLATVHGIEGGWSSDNKAREIVKLWRAGNAEFNVDAGHKTGDGSLTSVELKQLLILEMLDGPTGDDDERAIISILEGTSGEDILKILEPAGGVTIQDLESDVDGANYKRMMAVLEEKLPSLGETHLKRSAAPDKKSGACTVGRALQIHVAHGRAIALVNNAVSQLKKYIDDPKENKNVEEILRCYFKGGNRATAADIAATFVLMAELLPKVEYICPADPFEMYQMVNPQGGREILKCEADVGARAPLEPDAGGGAGGQQAGAGKAAAAPPPRRGPRVLICPTFFEFAPELQAKALVHESAHHAKRSIGDAEGEPECGKRDLGTALADAYSYAALAVKLEHGGMTASTDDCPPAWKTKLYVAAEKGYAWVSRTVNRLDAVLADPKKVDETMAFQLKRDFKVKPEEVDKVRKIRDALLTIQSKLTGGFSVECEMEATGQCVGEGGYVRHLYVLWSGVIHLCPQWFDEKPFNFSPADKSVGTVTAEDYRVETLLHEMAHKHANKWGDVYLRKELTAYLGLSQAEALDNADTYAQFARIIYEKTSG